MYTFERMNSHQLGVQRKTIFLDLSPYKKKMIPLIVFDTSLFFPEECFHILNSLPQIYDFFN